MPEQWGLWGIRFLSHGHYQPPLHICFLETVLGSVCSLVGSHLGPLAHTHVQPGGCWFVPLGPCVCVKQPQQKWPSSSSAAVSPVQTGWSSPGCVNCVWGKGQTNVPAPSRNRTLATRAPSSEWGPPSPPPLPAPAVLPHSDDRETNVQGVDRTFSDHLGCQCETQGPECLPWPALTPNVLRSLGSVCYPPGPMRYLGLVEGSKLYLGLWDS